MSNRERFAQIAHQKWVTMSKSLRSLTKNEQMIESLGFVLQITHLLIFFAKNEIFPQKTNEGIPNPVKGQITW